MKLWQATGQSNLAYKQLAATKASKVWFSYSYNCTLANGAVFHSVCPVARLNFSLLATAHDYETDLLETLRWKPQLYDETNVCGLITGQYKHL